MKQFIAQYLKDFKANFSNFNAYIILGAYSLLSFFFTFYVGDYFLRESDIMNSFFSLQPIVLMLVLPAVTMKSWADEIKSGTFELLLTQPISYFKLVFAKFCAAFTFFILMISFSLPLLFISFKFFVIDINCVILSYIGLILCGALFTSLGCLISLFNKNTILSYLSAILVLLIVSQLKFQSFTIGNGIIPLSFLNFEDNYLAFLSGVFQYGNLAYFIFTIPAVIWFNTIILKTKNNFPSQRKFLFYFLFLLIVFIFSGVLGVGFSFDKIFDITADHRFTLEDKHQTFLKTTDKRINIRLYEAKNKREDTNSGYAVYASFVERLLKLIEKASQKAVRTEFIQVEPFSTQERTLINRNIQYKEDNQGFKVYMTAEIFDNDGNSASIPAFNGLRQNLLETDIMRQIYRLGLPKQRVIIIGDENIFNYTQGFQNTLNEFYDVDISYQIPDFIPPVYASAVVINPMNLSSESLLAMEQYVLNGGNLFIFHEPLLMTYKNSQPLKNFLQNFGIIPDLNVFPAEEDTQKGLGPSYPTQLEFLSDIRSVLVNNAGTMNVKSENHFTTSPILTFNGQIIAAVSSGMFVSYFPEFAATIKEVIPTSIKPGKLFFIYDSDMLQNYMYASQESNSMNFYDIIPLSDNMLFFLKIFDYAMNTDIENRLSYRHYAINSSSIGSMILNSVKDRYANEMNILQTEINELEKKKLAFSNLLTQQGFASSKNIGNANDIMQQLEEKKDELNKINSLISQDYLMLISTYTTLVIFIIPLLLLLIVFICLKLIQRKKLNDIRRIINND